MNKQSLSITNKNIDYPLVSFIISSYNYENFIEQTLNSIKNQTYKNFEIIIVDDFSSDNSVSVIQNYINNNSNLDIQFIKHDKNYGQLKSILTGLTIANGDFISFIDSDDVLNEQYAEILLKVHKKINTGFVSCKAKEIKKTEENLIKTDKNKFSDYTKLKDLKNKPFGGWFWYPMSSAMFKKSAVEIILKYQNTDEWKICPDKFIFNFVNLIEGSVLIDINLFYKRKHENNAGNFNRTKLNIENNKKIRKLTLKFIKQNINELILKYNKNNILKYIAKIYLSYFYIPVQILKYVTKTLTSKIRTD